MATQKLPPLRVETIHAGMDDKNVPWAIRANNVVLAQNLDGSREGQVSRRLGVQDYGMRTDAPGGIWAMLDDAQGQEAVFSVYGGKIYFSTAAGEIGERACDVSLTGTLHMAQVGRYEARTAAYICSAQVADSDPSLASKLAVVIDTSGNANQTWTQHVSYAPRCAAWWQNRLWIADNVLSLNDETLWWSELNDGMSYSSFNTAIVESGQGGRITALQPIRSQTAPQMLVFKERAIAVIETYWGSSSSLIPIAADALDTIKSSIRLVTNNAGCVATRSVQFVPGAPGGDVYFLSLDGVRAISRANDDTLSGAGIPISDPIQGTIERINFEHADKAVSATFKDSYWLAVPLDAATENTHVLQFDMRNASWWIHTWAAKGLTSARLNQTQPQLWMQYASVTYDSSVTAGASGYHLFRCFQGAIDPNSTPVSWRIHTRAFVGEDLNRKKHWDNFSVFFRNNSTITMVATLEYNIDNSSWVTFATINAGGANEAAVILGETPLPWGLRQGIFRRAKFDLSDVNPAYTLEIRLTGQSELSVPTIYNHAVDATMLDDTFDNEVT